MPIASVRSYAYFYAGLPPAGSDFSFNFNQREGFAESVAAYVYQQVAESRVADMLARTYIDDSAPIILR